MTTRDVVFRDRYGLHPRSARRILETLAGVGSRVTIESLVDPGTPIDARSILALISSSIRAGDRVRVAADGPDEAAVVVALGDLIEAGVCHP